VVAPAVVEVPFDLLNGSLLDLLVAVVLLQGPDEQVQLLWLLVVLVVVAESAQHYTKVFNQERRAEHPKEHHKHRDHPLVVASRVQVAEPYGWECGERIVSGQDQLLSKIHLVQAKLFEKIIILFFLLSKVWLAVNQPQYSSEVAKTDHCENQPNCLHDLAHEIDGEQSSMVFIPALCSRFGLGNYTLDPFKLHFLHLNHKFLSIKDFKSMDDSDCLY